MRNLKNHSIYASFSTYNILINSLKCQKWQLSVCLLLKIRNLCSGHLNNSFMIMYKGDENQSCWISHELKPGILSCMRKPQEDSLWSHTAPGILFQIPLIARMKDQNAKPRIYFFFHQWFLSVYYTDIWSWICRYVLFHTTDVFLQRCMEIIERELNILYLLRNLVKGIFYTFLCK